MSFSSSAFSSFSFFCTFSHRSLGKNGDADAERQHHAQRHGDPEILLLLAVDLDLPQRGGDHHHAARAVDALWCVMQMLDVLLDLLAVLVLALDRCLLAQLHPGALRRLWAGGVLGSGGAFVFLGGVCADANVRQSATPNDQRDRDGADARNTCTNPRVQIRICHVAVDLSLENRSRARGGRLCSRVERCCVAGNKRRIAAIP